MCIRRKRKTNDESDAAIKDATESAQKIHARAPEVKELANSLKEIRARNHFAEQISIIMTHRKEMGKI